MQRSALCRSRRELSNEYLLAKIGVDTAENEPLEVWGKLFNIIHSCPYRSLALPVLQRHAKERHTPLHVGQPPIRRGLKGLDTGRAYSKTGNKDFVGV